MDVLVLLIGEKEKVTLVLLLDKMEIIMLCLEAIKKML